MEDITIQDLITEQKIESRFYIRNIAIWAFCHVINIRTWTPIISGLKRPKDS